MVSFVLSWELELGSASPPGQDLLGDNSESFRRCRGWGEGEADFGLMKSVLWGTWGWHRARNLWFFYSGLMAIEKPGRKCCNRKEYFVLCCPNLVAGLERGFETQVVLCCWFLF